MKILIIVDKQGTAIDRLAWMVKDNNPHLDIKILPVHPKRNDVDTLYEASNLIQWADLVDIHYWKSGEVLRQNFGEFLEKKPKILFHFNPYDADNEEVNKYYDMTVVGNEEIYSRVPYAKLVPYGVDLNYFKFKEEYTEEKIVNMVVGRIEGKKGVLEVAMACRELGYKFLLVGRVSKGEYMQEVLDAGGGSVEFWENASEEQLREAYYKSAIHVCNSVDNFESGTLPILEAMACGVPVLTRGIGHVPELFNGQNMLVRKGNQDNYFDLRDELKTLMENRELRLKIRDKAWDTARTRDSRKMARNITKLYYKTILKDDSFVSVIIPTKDNPEAFIECLVGALQQDYPKYEVVVADSGDTSVKKIIDEAKKKTNVPIKYIYFPHKGNYTLSEARNRAVIESEGDLLVFCDDRIKMDNRAVSAFIPTVANKTWAWGVKDGYAKGFVENFSAIRRDDLVRNGMFNERIQWYGGMTQELRTRFERELGFNFVLCDDAKAKGIKRASGKSRRRKDIIEAKYLVFKMYGE